MNFYFFINFFSILGDKLLLYALPVGIGVETGDIRYTVLMFLIPGLGMKVSTYFKNILKKRIKNSITDYSNILIVIAILELILIYLLSIQDELFYKAIICCVFVLLYSFAKEGIPRMFFSINIYNELFGNEKYERKILVDQVVNIIASFLGALIAAYLISTKKWELSFFVDAASFVLFSFGLKFLSRKKAKRDLVYVEKNNSLKESIPLNDIKETLRSIRIIVPLVTFVSCLYMPYISVIVDELNIISASKSVFVIGAANAIVMIINLLFMKRISFKIKKYIINATPFCFIILSLFFNIFPSQISWFLAVTIAGVYFTVFTACDYSLRKELSPEDQLEFNSSVLSKMSIAQLTSCVLAFVLFSIENSLVYISAIITVVFILLILKRNESEKTL